MSQIRRRQMGKKAGDGIVLPEGYTRLNGIFKQSGSGKCIVFANPPYPIYCKIIADIDLTSVSDDSHGYLLGRTGSFGLKINQTGCIRIAYSNTDVDSDPIIQQGVTTVFETVVTDNSSSDNNIMINGVSIGKSWKPTYKDYLYMGVAWSNSTYRLAFNLYDVEMWTWDVTSHEPGELRHKLIPCIRLSDNSYGVYDIITDTFTGGFQELNTNL